MSTLVEGAGNETYTAASNGTNGGAESAVALLVDAGGNDTYEDDDGGTGTDQHVVPKGVAGAQVDRDGERPGTPTPSSSSDQNGLLDIVVSVFDAISDFLTGLFDTLWGPGLLSPLGGT